MRQTPAHDTFNPDLLALIPRNARKLVEVGCSTGALARAYKDVNQECTYVGIELVPEYAQLANAHCDHVLNVNIQDVNPADLALLKDADCWIFGDTLEHLTDPWSVLTKIRKTIPGDGCVVACIPNAQHWSVQARLARGLFRYKESGLLDRSHLRWFTRITIFEMFTQCGYTVTEARRRVHNEPKRDKFLPLIKAMADATGGNPEQAVSDAIPFQYLVKAVPSTRS